MLRQRLVRPYEHVKHVSNFKSHGRRWRPCGRIFKFCKFWRKERKIEALMSFPKTGNEIGAFGQIRKNSLFRFCRPIRDIFGLTSLISNHAVFLVQFEINLHLWNFQKAEIALTEAACTISAFWKTNLCKWIPNWTRNRMITYTNCTNPLLLLRQRKWTKHWTGWIWLCPWSC